MEWFLIALTSLLATITPVGLVVDNVIDHNIRDRVKSVEELSVRVDNVPSYQLIEGKVNRVRIASRGLEIIDDVRIEILDIETDAINLKLNDLKTGNLEQIRSSLRSPLQAAFNLIITEKDLNQALADPKIKARLQTLLSQFLPTDIPSLQLISSKIIFKEANRVQIQVQLLQKSDDSEPPDELNLVIESGIKIIQGRSLELIDASASLNGRKISQRILQSVIGSFSDRLNLKQFEKQGIIARLLKFQIEDHKINISAFVRLNPLVDL